MPHYPYGEIKEGYKGKFFQKEVLNGVEVLRYAVFPDHSRSMLRRLVSMLTLSLSVVFSFPVLWQKKPTLIIAQSPPMAMPTLAVMFSWLLGAKLILNASDLWPRALVDLGVVRQGMLYRFLRLHERFLFWHTDGFLAQSIEIQEYIQEIISPKKTGLPILLYRTGTDVSRFSPKLTYQQKSPAFRMVYTGVLGIAHGLFPLCQSVFDQLSGIELHIFGEGSERGDLVRWIAETKQKSVLWNPALAPENIPDLLSTFDAGLVVQRSPVLGTVPSKLYDYMAAGLPVIFIGAGEGAKLVRETGCGWVLSPHEIPETRQLLYDFAQLPTSEKAQMGERGRLAATQFFDRKKQHRYLLDFLGQHKFVNFPVFQPSSSC
jgi:Glycosyl transferases group 1